MLIQGGTVVTSGGEQRADILVQEGKITAIRPGIPVDAETIDAGGLLVLPGVVDPHTHLLLDTGTARTSDDYASGSASAAAGGVTTYLEFVPQLDGHGFLESVAARRRLIDGQTHVDYGIHLSVSHLADGWERELEALVDTGVTSAKIYTTYRDTIFYADDWTWYRLMERSGRAGLLVQVHAENDAIVEGMTRQLLREGKRALRYHGVARPAVAEAEAVARGLLFSRSTGSPVYFVHLSTPLAVDLIASARRDGIQAIAETCPHYLVLDESVYERSDAARFLMTPPLRDRDAQAGLWRHVHDAAIQTMGSDHCGFSLDDRTGIDDFSAISPGIPGVETSLVLLYTQGVKSGRIRLPDMVRLLSENSARIFGLWPRKGTLAPGSDADIVLFDPGITRQLSATELHSRARFSPYEGMTVSGQVKATILRGRVVYRDGQVIGDLGYGEYQACDQFDWKRAMP